MLLRFACRHDQVSRQFITLAHVSIKLFGNLTFDLLSVYPPDHSLQEEEEVSLLANQEISLHWSHAWLKLLAKSLLELSEVFEHDGLELIDRAPL